MAFWKESLKKFRLPGFKPWPVRYWCIALTSFQASELVIKLVHNIPRKDYCDDFLCIYFFILQLKYMKFIYLSFQGNNNKYYTRSKNTCVMTESTKKTTTQPRWFQFSLFAKTKPRKANARQWERAKICQGFSSPTKLQVTQCIETSTNYQENARHCSWQQKLWSVIPFTAWPVMATLEHWAIKQRRQIWGVIVNSNTSGM